MGGAFTDRYRIDVGGGGELVGFRRALQMFSPIHAPHSRELVWGEEHQGQTGSTETVRIPRHCLLPQGLHYLDGLTPTLGRGGQTLEWQTTSRAAFFHGLPWLARLSGDLLPIVA